MKAPRLYNDGVFLYFANFNDDVFAQQTAGRDFIEPNTERFWDI